jgi:hypothetical protein
MVHTNHALTGEITLNLYTQPLSTKEDQGPLQKILTWALSPMPTQRLQG